ncbi:MAG: type II secretion system F family protein [Candidatus Micrarchaeota archaeon]|nr:type II secretion system F family protein [Candidatus Micrarchaeota archaeon]
MEQNDKNATMAPRSHHPLVAQPLRETEGASDPRQFRTFFRSISLSFPLLRRQLIQAQMNYTPAGFVSYALSSAVYITAVLLLVLWLLLRSTDFSMLLLLVLAPIVYAAMFIYLMQFPLVKARQRAKRIDQEIVFAGRHMLIELQSGVPLFDAMLGISRDYGPVSEEFNKIVEKVTLGVPLGAALHEVAENNPSAYFNRLVLQLANSLASGADVALTLESSLDQISKEQILDLKAYGQKLNPLVMFFMIFGIIMPSLGVAFMIMLVSFLGGSGISFGPAALFGILACIGIIQFIFLSVVESSRPKFDIV